jgi:hypothetical protein
MFSASTALASGNVAKQGQGCGYRDDSKLGRVRDQRDCVLEICLCTPLSALHYSGGLLFARTFVDIWVFCAVIACPGCAGRVALLSSLASRPLNLGLGQFVI